MNFCSACGSPVTLSIPDGDNRVRHICKNCQTIHYQNPKVVVGVIATHKDRLLLCKRAIEPRFGYWTIPAGYMENGETLEEGARREAWEEARAQLGELRPFAALDIPHINQVYFLFAGELESGEVRPGPESSAVELVEKADIPWDQLAFRVVTKGLQSWLDNPSPDNFRLLRIDGAKKH